MIVRAAGVALFVLVTPAAHAQDTTTISLDTLTVTALRGGELARVPAAVTIVGPERTRAGRLGLTLDEALADVPGVVVSNRYNFALGTRVAIRGFGARSAFGVRGVRVLQDGIPLTLPDGQTNLNNVDLLAAGRIEVVRGSAAMLHGNAAGGVIDIRSETPPPGFSLEARAAAAHLDRSGLGDLRRLDARAGGGSAALRYLLSAAHAAGDGSRDHARLEQTNLNVRIERLAPSARTSATLSIADAPVAQNPGSLPLDSARLRPEMAWPRNVLTGSGERSRQVQGGVRHEHALGGVRFDALAYGVSRTLDNPLPFAYITLDRTGGGLRSSVAWHTLTLGLDIELQSDGRAEYENVAGERGTQRRDQTDRVASLGSFARVVLPVAARTSLTAGIRYDRVRFEVEDRFLTDGRDDSGARTLAAVSPAAGITHAIAGGPILFANASTAFLTPTTTELINAPPPQGQACCPAGFNRDLEPERARSLEIGVRGRTGRLAFDAAAYRITVRDALVSFQVPQAEGRAFFRNAGRTRTLGVEVAARLDVTRAITVATSFTHNDVRFRDDGIATVDNEDNRVPGVPPQRFVVRAVARTAPLVLEADADATSAYYADDANTIAARNQGVVVLGARARASRPLGRWRIEPFAAVMNLTDRRYNASVVVNAVGGRYFEPAPGRSLLVGAGVRFGGRS